MPSCVAHPYTQHGQRSLGCERSLRRRSPRPARRRAHGCPPVRRRRRPTLRNVPRPGRTLVAIACSSPMPSSAIHLTPAAETVRRLDVRWRSVAPFLSAPLAVVRAPLVVALGRVALDALDAIEAHHLSLPSGVVMASPGTAADGRPLPSVPPIDPSSFATLCKTPIGEPWAPLSPDMGALMHNLSPVTPRR